MLLYIWEEANFRALWYSIPGRKNRLPEDGLTLKSPRGSPYRMASPHSARAKENSVRCRERRKFRNLGLFGICNTCATARPGRKAKIYTLPAMTLSFTWFVGASYGSEIG